MKHLFSIVLLALVFTTTAAHAQDSSQAAQQLPDLTTIDTSAFPDLTASCIHQLNEAIDSARKLRDQTGVSQQPAMLLFVKAAEAAIVGQCQIDLQKKAEKEAVKAKTQEQLDAIRNQAIATSAAIKTEGEKYLALYQF